MSRTSAERPGFTKKFLACATLRAMTDCSPKAWRKKTFYCFSSAVPQLALSSFQAEQFRHMTEAAKTIWRLLFLPSKFRHGKNNSVSIELRSRVASIGR